jgi:hypothetical protein
VAWSALQWLDLQAPPLTDAACIAAAQHRMQGRAAGAEGGETVLLKGRSALQQQYT